MRIAESVTFGGGAGALDRAADRRGRPGEVARLAAEPSARVLPFWRGRPLMTPEGRLGWVPAGHPVLEGARAPILLGIVGAGPDGGGARAAVGASGEPDASSGSDASADPAASSVPSGAGASVIAEASDDPEGPRLAVDLGAWAPAEAAPEGAPQPHPAAPPGHGFADLRAAAPRLSPLDAELAATARALTAWHASHGFCARCGARSHPSQAGWQRECPVCHAHHFPRTDPVVIMLATHGEAVLLGRSPGWPEGMFSLLAGFVEPGETIEAAARRELWEEAGVRTAEVGYLASQPWPFPASLMIGARARALSRELTLDPVEIEDALWLTREEAALAFGGRHPRVRPPREGAIAGFLLRAWLADRLG